MDCLYFILPDLAAGGAERVSITIARILKKRGFNVKFLNLGKADGDMYSWIVPEFELISFGCSRVLESIPKLYSFMRKNKDARFFSSREHVNIVNLFCSGLLHSNVIVRIPNMPKNQLVKGISGLKALVVKKLNKYLLSNAKHVIAQNQEMLEQLIEVYDLPSDKVVAINNPIDKEYVLNSALMASNPFPKGESVFLCVCNIAYSKGIDVLMKAWPKVTAAITNAHLYIVGRTNSEYAQIIMNQADGLQDFTFLGFQGNPYPFLKYCNVFVLPSRMEGFPNVVLEAMCFNRPIASTTCVSVIKDIIKEGRNGYYCPIEDDEALADCMIKAYSLSNINNNYDLFNEQNLIKIFS